VPEVGDQIQVAGTKVDQATRSGVVTDVRGRMITVQWATGDQSVFVPAPGTLTVLGRADTRPRRTTGRARASRSARGAIPTRPTTTKKAARKTPVPKPAKKAAAKATARKAPARKTPRKVAAKATARKAPARKTPRKVAAKATARTATARKTAKRPTAQRRTTVTRKAARSRVR
jgi:Domain of unknown function (DUF1918)